MSGVRVIHALKSKNLVL